MDRGRHYGVSRPDPELLKALSQVTMQDPFLKKSLGQHHLRDGALCRPLIEYLRPAGHRVLEIGAGAGVLTEELAAAGASVLACEVDLEWAFALRRRMAGRRPRILALDALRIDWRRLPAPTLVAGNLPFNVATRLIQSLLPHPDVVPRAAFLVQKEVAERLVARPGDPAFGSLSVLVAAQAEVRYLATVRPGSFLPPPKVAAAFVGLELEAPPVSAAEMPAFARIVRLAFAQRRKTLRNSLASGLGRRRAGDLLRAVGWDVRRRAQELDVAAFVELFEAYRHTS